MGKQPLTYYSKREEHLNVFTHALGLVLSIVALVVLVRHAVSSGTTRHIVSFTIFGASLILLYSASTFYHYTQSPSLRKKLNINPKCENLEEAAQSDPPAGRQTC